MARGRKVQKNTAPKLSTEPPKGLPVAVRQCWIKIREQIEYASGAGLSAADNSMLESAAYQMAMVVRLRKDSADTPINLTENKATRIHPVHTELRAAESLLRGSLQTLCLTPRSRKGWRSQPDATGAPVDDATAQDPILKLLG